MTARADDLDLVCDAFAMGAAVFRFLGGDAVTGSISAFPGIVRHDPPLPVLPRDQAIPADVFDAGL
jgi:hypothetical protein